MKQQEEHGHPGSPWPSGRRLHTEPCRRVWEYCNGEGGVKHYIGHCSLLGRSGGQAGVNHICCGFKMRRRGWSWAWLKIIIAGRWGHSKSRQINIGVWILYLTVHRGHLILILINLWLEKRKYLSTGAGALLLVTDVVSVLVEICTMYLRWMDWTFLFCFTEISGNVCFKVTFVNDVGWVLFVVLLDEFPEPDMSLGPIFLHTRYS